MQDVTVVELRDYLDHVLMSGRAKPDSLIKCTDEHLCVEPFVNTVVEELETNEKTGEVTLFMSYSER